MNSENKKEPYTKSTAIKDQINLDYDWNTEYGDGDIPNVDTNVATTQNPLNLATTSKVSEKEKNNHLK